MLWQQVGTRMEKLVEPGVVPYELGLVDVVDPHIGFLVPVDARASRLIESADGDPQLRLVVPSIARAKLS